MGTWKEYATVTVVMMAIFGCEGGGDGALVFRSPAAVSVSECQAEVTRVQTEGGEGPVAYGIEGVDASDFEVDVDTGVVTFLRDKLPDYERKESYQLIVTALDASGESIAQELVIGILPWSTTHNGVEYGCTPSPYTGRVWLDRNLGATKVCENKRDTECYGDYYQWGRNSDGHEKGDSDTTTELATDVNDVGHGKFILNPGGDFDWVDPLVDTDGTVRENNWKKTDGSSVCPAGYRVPTLEEIEADLLNPGSAEITNIDDAVASFLKLPPAGYRTGHSGRVDAPGAYGYYWSANNRDGRGAYGLYMSMDAGTLRSVYMSGWSVRCIREE